MKRKAPPIGYVSLNELHLDLVRHGKRVSKYAQAIPAAKKAVADAKKNLTVKKADLQFKIRSDPTTYGLKGRPNKEDVAAAVILQPEYQKMLSRLNRREYDHDMLEAAMVVLRDEKNVIEELIKLIGFEYFDPHVRVDKNAQGRAREVYERADQQSGFSRRRKK